MTFFYDLNKRLADLASKQDAKQISEDAKAVAPKSMLAESLKVAEAGYSAKAGRAGKDLGKPGKNFGKIAKSAGERYGSKEAGERVAGAVLNKLRHPKESIGQVEEAYNPVKAVKQCAKSYMEMNGIRSVHDLEAEDIESIGGDCQMNYQDVCEILGCNLPDSLGPVKSYDEHGDMEEGNAFTGALAKTPKGGKVKVGNKEFTDTSSLEEVGGKPMTPKQKSFAKLAPPTNKITFADKIAGAKKEVDEMLGDVAAEAMRKAVVGHAGEQEMDEGYAEMDAWLKSREKEKGTGKFDKKERTLPSGMKATTYTRRHEEEPEDDSDAPVAKGGAPKKKGRPAGTRRAIGAKHSGRSKLASKDAIAEEGEGHVCEMCGQPVVKEGEHLGRPAKYGVCVVGHNDGKPVKTFDNEADAKAYADKGVRIGGKLLQGSVRTIMGEKAKSKAQQKFMGMVHATQKGEKAPSKEVAKVAKEMPEKAAKDFAATKHKGLPEKVKSKKKDEAKEEKVDETTTSGSVATASAAPKAGKGMQFGKGVYESLNKQYKQALTESMNVTVNLSTDDQGKPQKSITVTATDDDADKLAELLKMAGLEHHEKTCEGCGCSPCECDSEMVDENSPDWPTNDETLEAEPNLRTYSGGLNGPKSTGQTTIPVIASQARRQASMEENVKLERSLFNTWKNYKG